MFDKKLLTQMFNFTTNKKKTIKIGIIMAFCAIPYLVFYQYLVSHVIDRYIPEKNIKNVLILSSILIVIIFFRFWTDKYGDVGRKLCYYDNDKQIKNKIFNSIQDANISQIEKIQIGKLFNITTTQSFEAAQLFVWNILGIFSVRIRSILITSIIMLFINWKIALVVIGIFILSYIILIPFYNKNMKNYKKAL